MIAARFTERIILILVLVCSNSFAQKDYSADLLASAKRGDANAQNDLGVAYSEGLGIKPNQKEAVN